MIIKMFNKKCWVNYFILTLFICAVAAGESQNFGLMDNIFALDVEGVKAALDKGADPNAGEFQRKEFLKPIEALMFFGAMFPEPEFSEKTKMVAQLLFDAGAKIDPNDKILLYPIKNGDEDLVELLLQYGANPIGKIEGMLPTEWAAAHNQRKIIDLLVSHGAKPISEKLFYKFSLIYSASHKDVPGIWWALLNGAEINWKNPMGQTALGKYLDGPLWGEKDVLAIKILLKMGADPNLPSKVGLSNHDEMPPLHVVIRSNPVKGKYLKLFNPNSDKEKKIHEEMQHLTAEVLMLLIQNGARVSSQDSNGMTPLHLAAREDNLLAGLVLLKAGSKTMPRDAQGKTPLDYAESGEMILILKEHGATE